ncbi:MAG: B12-binding domain-containing radical SAM protein [Candidatus Heimdallarchaeota archaeon]
MKTSGKRIVITADRSMMSDYHGIMFIGFSATIPNKFMPDFFRQKTFFPTIASHSDGTAKFAPLGIRKIESALLKNDFGGEVVVAHPDHLAKVVGSETKIIGISTEDPLGKGPASSTFASILGGEAYTTKSFRTLITHPLIRKYKSRVVVGGQGAWQLQDEKIMDKYNIDFLFLGEADTSINEVFKNIIDGNQVPRIISGKPTPLEAIPCIENPTINGIVEISRGCDRGCSFCTPTLRGRISRPIAHIMKEIELNFSHGVEKVLLQSEDILRYGAKGIHVNSEKVKNLFRRVCSHPRFRELQVVHVSLSSVMDAPRLLGELSEIAGVGKNQPWIGAQTGIETGSTKLMEKHMRGKAIPFTVKEWPEIVENGFGVLQDCGWLPAGTLVLGLPGETINDITDTLALLDDLYDYQSIIVPLFFAPTAQASLNERKSYKLDEKGQYHRDVVSKCLDHDSKWAPLIIKTSLRNFNPFLRFNSQILLKLLVWSLRRNLKRIKPLS